MATGINNGSFHEDQNGTLAEITHIADGGSEQARTGSSSMTVNNKRIRNGADSCFLTMIMIEKTLSFLSMMSLRCLLPLLPRPLEKAAATTITIKKIEQG